jgi:hypothetical protein
MQPEDQEGLKPEEIDFLQAVESFVTEKIKQNPKWKPVAERFEVSLGFAHEMARLRHGEEDMYFALEDARKPGRNDFTVRVYAKGAAHAKAAAAAAAHGGTDPCKYWCYVNGALVCCGVSPTP